MFYRLFMLLLTLIASPVNAEIQMSVPNAHQFEFKTIEGETIKLADYKGKVILVVNTASQCGFTPQYAGLQSLHEKYGDKGLVIIGVPSDNFGGQEFEQESEVKEFTTKEFKTTFPLTTISNVKGSDAHPFYQWANKKAGFLGSPKWNFHKYLIGADGEFLAWFSSPTKPEGPKITAAIEKALANATPNQSVKANTETKKVLFVLTSHEKLGDTGKKTGFFLSELTHPHKVLVDAGYQIDFTSPKGGESPIDSLNLDDPINQAFMNNATFANAIKTTLKPSDVNVEDYDAIYFAGGHGTMWDLPNNQELASITAQIYENGGVVGAVCHGPSGLVNVKFSDGSYLVDGKQVSAFTNEEEAAVELTDVVPFLLEDKLKERGAIHSSAPKFEEHVVTSERLVTGQNPASATSVGEAMLVLLQK